MDNVLKLGTLSKLAGISVRGLNKAIERGQLRATKSNNTWVVQRNDFDEWMAKRKVSGEMLRRWKMHEELVAALGELCIAVDEFTSASLPMNEAEAAENRLDRALSNANALLVHARGESDESRNH